MKTCPQCQKTHSGTGVCCSRVCGRRARIVRVSFECKHCHETRLLKPSEAAGRTFCSHRCACLAKPPQRTEASRRGGKRGAQVRHANWWRRLMQSIDLGGWTKPEAYRQGYLTGYRRALNKMRRSA